MIENLLNENIKYLQNIINETPLKTNNEDYNNNEITKLVNLNEKGIYTVHYHYKRLNNNIEIRGCLECFINTDLANKIETYIKNHNEFYYLLDDGLSNKKTNIPFQNKYFSMTCYIKDNIIYDKNEVIQENFSYYNETVELFSNNKKCFKDKSYLILISKEYNYNGLLILDFLNNIIQI